MDDAFWFTGRARAVEDVNGMRWGKECEFAGGDGCVWLWWSGGELVKDLATREEVLAVLGTRGMCMRILLVV